MLSRRGSERKVSCRVRCPALEDWTAVAAPPLTTHILRDHAADAPIYFPGALSYWAQVFWRDVILAFSSYADASHYAGCF